MYVNKCRRTYIYIYVIALYIIFIHILESLHLSFDQRVTWKDCHKHVCLFFRDVVHPQQLCHKNPKNPLAISAWSHSGEDPKIPGIQGERSCTGQKKHSCHWWMCCHIITTNSENIINIIIKKFQVPQIEEVLTYISCIWYKAYGSGRVSPPPPPQKNSGTSGPVGVQRSVKMCFLVNLKIWDLICQPVGRSVDKSTH